MHRNRRAGLRRLLIRRGRRRENDGTAEAVIGLAIVLAIYQNLRTIDVGAAETMSG